MKKTWMKALEVTFVDGLSQTCRLLFETCAHVRIGYFIHSGVFMCFLQNCQWVPGYPKILNFRYPVLEITENAKSYIVHVYL